MIAGSMRYLAELQSAAEASQLPPSELTREDLRRVLRNLLETQMDIRAPAEPPAAENGIAAKFSRLFGRKPEPDGRASIKAADVVQQVLADLRTGRSSAFDLPGGPWGPGSDSWLSAKQDCINELSISMERDIALHEVERADRQVRELVAAFPTLRVVDYPHWVIQKHKILMIHTARKFHPEIPQDLVIGRAATSLVNAMIVRNPYDGDYLVVIDSGLKGFTNKLSKLFIANYFRNVFKIQGILDAWGGKSDFADLVETLSAAFPESVETFRTLITSYLYAGDTVAGERIRLNPMEHRSAYIVEECMELFVVGHELSHFVFGHLKEAQLRRSMSARMQNDEMVVAHAEEFEADEHGLKLMLEACSAICPDRVFAYVGAYLYLNAIQLVERAVSLAATGSEATFRSATHPPIAQRIEKLKVAAERELKAWPDSAQAKGIVTMTGLFMESWFQGVVPILKKKHNEGVPLAPVWAAVLGSVELK